MSENTENKQELKEVVEGVKKIPFEEYVDGEKPTEMGDRLQKMAEQQKQDLEKVETVEECERIEQELIKKMEDFDKYIATVEYELPTMVKFNERSYTRQEVAEKIREFINRQEVKWQAALGIWQMYNLWKNPPKTISYGAYDSTLRMLGSMSFKGSKDCESILVINDYFAQCNDGYAKDLTMLTYLSTLHSQVLDRIKAIEQMNSPFKPEEQPRNI